MQQTLHELLDQLTTGTPAAQEEAALCLGLLLEKHSTRADTPETYAVLLPPELVSLIMTSDEQQDVIDALGSIVLSPQITPAIVDALSSTTLPQAVEPLLRVLQAGPHSLEQATLRRVLNGIDHFVQPYEETARDREISRYVRAHNPVDALRELVGMPPGHLKEVAQRILHKLAERELM